MLHALALLVSALSSRLKTPGGAHPARSHASLQRRRRMRARSASMKGKCCTCRWALMTRTPPACAAVSAQAAPSLPQAFAPKARPPPSNTAAPGQPARGGRRAPAAPSPPAWRPAPAAGRGPGQTAARRCARPRAATRPPRCCPGRPAAGWPPPGAPTRAAAPSRPRRPRRPPRLRGRVTASVTDRGITRWKCLVAPAGRPRQHVQLAACAPSVALQPPARADTGPASHPIRQAVCLSGEARMRVVRHVLASSGQGSYVRSGVRAS